MHKNKKIIIGVIGGIAAVGFVLGVFGFIKGVQESQNGKFTPDDEVTRAFQEELTDRALARGPHPIEGFDALMLLDTFLGLEESDFDGVETGIAPGEGMYSFLNGELRWERTSDQPVTSAERSISPDGYGTLLKNLSVRFTVPASTVAEAVALIDKIDIPADVADHIASKKNLIVVHTPRPFSAVSSPLTLQGEARGTWYFEANFPVRIEDANGTVLGRHFATAGADWMTEAFVPFEAELSFTAPTTAEGVLVLEKDNPSGLPKHADELRIPVRFHADETPMRTVMLYYYDPAADTDAQGNIMCSDAGLVAVERTIPVTRTPIQDTINLLLRGELTQQEKARGVTTEYPLEGLELIGASLADGVLTLSFDDPRNATSGGSCRVGILWFQIRETALQFDGVDEVRFQPEVLFQP